MRLLLLSPDFPFPPTNGTRHKIYQLLKHLAGEHAMHLLAFHEPKSAPTREELGRVLETGCREVMAFPWRQDPAVWDACASALELAPHSYRKFRSPAFRHRLRMLMQQHAFDVVHCDINMTEMGSLLQGGEATVVSPSDSFTKMMLRMSQLAPGVLRKGYTLTQALKFWHAERYLYPRFTKCHVVTEPEAAFLRKLSPRSDIAVVPTGGDVPADLQPQEETEIQPDIVLSGQMSNPFTADSVLWFHRNVWPRIRARVPRSRLWLVGRTPGPEILALPQQDPSVLVTGYVPDMVEALKSKAVYVCPLLYGVGIRTRLFEPMANGIPVVSTSIGAEGIDLVPGQHALIEDSPAPFADAVIELLTRADLRRRLAQAAHQLVKARYTWEAYARGMEQLYGEAVRKHQSSRR